MAENENETETETETSEHTHTSVHDACSIHAAMAANHRAQMRMTILGLVGLWMIMILIVVNGAADRAAQGKPAAVATAPAASACAPLTPGCTITGTGGALAPAVRHGRAPGMTSGSGGSGGTGVEHGLGMGVVTGGSGYIADHPFSTGGSGKVYSGSTAR